MFYRRAPVVLFAVWFFGYLDGPAVSAQAPAVQRLPTTVAPAQQPATYASVATASRWAPPPPDTTPSTVSSLNAYSLSSAPSSSSTSASAYASPMPGIVQPPGIVGNGLTADAVTSAAGGTGAVGATSGSGLDTDDYSKRVLTGDDPWTWQLLPTGLMYKTYLAGAHEPRLGTRWAYSGEQGWIWDATLGTRIGLFRYGTENDLWSQGWQFDVEGSAFPRLDDVGDLVSNDYTFAAPLTTRQGPWEWKYGYRHYCSHVADEHLLKNLGFPRINYVRDSMFLGLAFYVNPSLRMYCEAGWGFWCDGGAEPWEYQFGVDLSPPGPTNNWGAPFFAVSAHLREENDFGGNVTMQTGWQWRGRTGHLLRFGAHYFNGMSEQAQFYNVWEEAVGFGLWYDF